MYRIILKSNDVNLIQKNCEFILTTHGVNFVPCGTDKSTALAMFREAVRKRMAELIKEKLTQLELFPQPDDPDYIHPDNKQSFIPALDSQSRVEMDKEARKLIVEARERLENPDLDYELRDEDRCNATSNPPADLCNFRTGAKNLLLKQHIHTGEGYTACIKKGYA